MASPEHPTDAPHEWPSVDGELSVEKRWLGIVNSVEGETFYALLTDPTKPGQAILNEVDKSQVSDKEQALIIENASFEWIIGHVDNAVGQRMGISMIRFNTPETLTETEKQEALQAGVEMERRLLAGESHRLTLD